MNQVSLKKNEDFLNVVGEIYRMSQADTVEYKSMISEKKREFEKQNHTFGCYFFCSEKDMLKCAKAVEWIELLL